MPSPRTALPAEVERQPVEGPVEMSRIVTTWPRASRSAARVAPTRPQPTMTIFMDSDSSAIGSRMTMTAHGAFLRTYGTVRPIAKSPPKRFR